MSDSIEKSRVFRRGGFFDYLPESDRHLSAALSTRFRFGFIGCGMMGQEHMRNALLSGSGSVHGMYDPAETSVRHALARLSKLQHDQMPRVYTSLEEACVDPETDALIIATPNFTHLDVMRVAVKTGKALLLEKPIATSVADALAIGRLLERYGNVVRIGLQYRHKAVYAEALVDVLEQKRIGNVCSVNMFEHRFPFLDKVNQWNKFNKYTGGVLVEKCCHYFDLMNLFAQGLPEQVYAQGSQAVNFKNFTYNNEKSDGIDQAQVSIKYNNGVLGAFSLSMFVPGSHEELLVCGDAGRLRASEKARLNESVENELELWLGENGASRITQPSYPAYIAAAGHHGSTFYEHLAFLKDLESGTYQGPSLQDAVLSVVVGAAAQASIEQGAIIDVADLLPAEQYFN